MFKVLKNNFTGQDAVYLTTLEYGFNGNNLEFSFACENSQRFSAYMNDNEPLYLGDVAEVFIRVGDDPDKYFEIEVAPNGAVFFAKINRFNDKLNIEYLPRAFTAEVSEYKSGYKVFISISENVLGINGTEAVYFNAFRIETDGGTPEKHLFALNPTLCDTFHVPEKFLLFDEF